MDYKIFYIDDQDTESRQKDLEGLGYIVKRFDPTPNLNDLFTALEVDTSASILDYRLTKGKNQACFDAPTIAQTLRTKYKSDLNEFPLILMSNESIKVAEFDKDLTSQDLFDFVLTKEDFLQNNEGFQTKLTSFIEAYKKIKDVDFCLENILLKSEDKLHSRIKNHTNELGKNLFQISNFIYYDIVRPTGLLIGEDILSARLGVDSKSGHWEDLKSLLSACCYKGIFSNYLSRWWMNDISSWWNDNISDISLRKFNSQERVELLKKKLGLSDLNSIEPTEHSRSSNFWTICKYSKDALDPFDGVELLFDKKQWQDKEYVSIDSALAKMENYIAIVSDIDKKAIREIAKNDRGDG